VGLRATNQGNPPCSRRSLLPALLLFAWLSATQASASFSLPDSGQVGPPDSLALVHQSHNVAARHKTSPLAPRNFASGPLHVTNYDDLSGSEYSSSKFPVSSELLPTSSTAIALAAPVKDRFQTGAALKQSFSFLIFQHVARLGLDPSLRYLVVHKPFFHDWFASEKGVNLTRWGDGDDFLVNDIGHPLQGAVSNRIFLQNDPRAYVHEVGRSGDYWKSRLKGMAWATVFSAQWKAGPLSEVSIGSAGGWNYVPQCGTSLACLKIPGLKPPNNNTGLTDWVITPVVGMGWVVAEDTIERFISNRIVESHPQLGWRILRGCLTPSRSMANLFQLQRPWERSPTGSSLFSKNSKPDALSATRPTGLKNWEFGIQYTGMNLPTVQSDCLNCREFRSGLGGKFSYMLNRTVGFDNEVNYLPATGKGGYIIEGLFGVKFGHRWQNWGLFAKIRPGFAYYEAALEALGSTKVDDLTRFVADLGGAVEYYPSRNAAFRVDVGSTMIRYPRSTPDPRTSPLGSLLSPQYIVTQGNLQISSGYVFRF